MLSHRAEVVVSKKDTEFVFLRSRCELAQAVVGQLRCSGLQELLRDQTCQRHRVREPWVTSKPTIGKKQNTSKGLGV